MKTGNSMPAANDRHFDARVRNDSQLRDIEDLVAKLQLVTKQLSFPTGAGAAPAGSGEADAEAN
ncbi:MAG TPA: hypothetical protein VG164_01970 [Trebonia sp.]|jgi:hypothetical protein|nr:hypothetical protein [Trebonia sp.]